MARTHKEIVCVWAFSTNFKQLFEVVELSVNVTTNLPKQRQSVKSLVMSKGHAVPLLGPRLSVHWLPQ